MPSAQFESVLTQGSASFPEMLCWLQMYAEDHEKKLPEVQTSVTPARRRAS